MCTADLDVSAAHARIEREARVKASVEVRRVPSIQIRQAVRQGDIYLHRVPLGHSRSARLIDSGQLAEGQTQGSRHVAAAPARCFEGTNLPEGCAAGTFLGPCIISNAPFTVTHPEHAHIELPAGVYQVTHQMDARTLERVRD